MWKAQEWGKERSIKKQVGARRPDLSEAVKGGSRSQGTMKPQLTPGKHSTFKKADTSLPFSSKLQI